MPAQGSFWSRSGSALIRATGAHGGRGAMSTRSAVGCPSAALSLCVPSVSPLLVSVGPHLEAPPFCRGRPTSPNLTLLICQKRARTAPSRAVAGRAVTVLEGTGVTTQPGPDTREDSTLWAAWQTRSRSNRARLRKGPPAETRPAEHETGPGSPSDTHGRVSRSAAPPVSCRPSAAAPSFETARHHLQDRVGPVRPWQSLTKRHLEDAGQQAAGF